MGSVLRKVPGVIPRFSSTVIALVLLFSMMVLPPGGARAASVIEVDDDAAPGWYDAAHVHTIEEGVAAAADGDTVLVHPGLYLGTVTINKRLSLVSTDGAASTIVRSTGTYAIRIYSDWVNVTGFTAESADYGIDVVTFDHCTVKDCVAKGNDYGIRFHTTQDSRLLGCNASGSSNYGLYIYNSPGILIRGNWVNGTGILDNTFGVFVRASHDAVLERNRVFNNSGYGLRIYENDDVRMENNTVEGNGGIGLSLEVDKMTRMRNNTFGGNKYDIYLLGNSLATFQQDIDTSNIVTSGPVHYYVGGSDFTVPSGAGMVGLVQCTNVTVSGLSMSRAGQGVVMAHSSGCTLDGLYLDGCHQGIELYYSDYNEVMSCTANGSNEHGLLLRTSTHNLIADCSFVNTGKGNIGNGIFGDFSHYSRVERCNVSGNKGNGVSFRNSDHCHVNDTISNDNTHANGVFAYLSNYFSARGNDVRGNGNGILVSQSSSNCVIADNQVFDNNKQSSKRGIEVYYSDLAILTNNTVVGNRYGIWVYSSDDAVLRFNTVRDSQEFGGIYVYGALTVTLENNTAEGNVRGIYVNNPGAAYYDYNNSVVANNTLLDSSQEGLRVDGRFKNATIARNIIEGAGAGYYGIRLSDLTRDSIIYDNKIACAWNAYDAGADNAWNVSKTAGKNIMGGDWIGGNYFSNYSGPDADMDGIGDVPFGIAGPGGSQDLLPLATEVSKPSMPLGLVAEGGVAQAQLSWNPPSDDGGAEILNYSVYRGPSPASLSLLVKLGNVTEYVDVDVMAGHTYYYAVSAHNVAGEGAMSPAEAATIMDIPSMPTLFNVAAGDGQVLLTWSAPDDDGGSGIANYTVYRGPAAGSLTALVKLGNVTSYLDEAVSNGNVYYYGLTASNAVGEGAMTPAVGCMPTWSAHYPSCAITSPSGLYVNSDDVAMTWTMSDSISGIDFAEVRLDSGVWVLKDDATSHVFTDVADGQHTLSLRVHNNAGYSNSTSRTIVVDTVPPTNVANSWSQPGASGTLTVTFSEAMGSVQGLVDGQPASFSLLDRNATAVVTLAPGMHNLTMTGTDLAGNPLSGFAPFQFTVVEYTVQVSGRVVDGDGDPISGALVDIDGVQAITDSDGWFFCSVPPGQHEIAITASGREGYVGLVTVDDGELGDFTLEPVEDGGGEGMDWTLIIIVVAVAMALLILFLLFWKRRRKDEEEGAKKKS